LPKREREREREREPCQHSDNKHQKPDIPFALHPTRAIQQYRNMVYHSNFVQAKVTAEVEVEVVVAEVKYDTRIGRIG
jgi:hypothetical protein